ncbi:hypothetical protein BDQ17DRAFT_1474567 [Cyathus striatus]|nr:hypothetical protein BDQ17DRAFT_1474567 [Cyathus striatus]
MRYGKHLHETIEERYRENKFFNNVMIDIIQERRRQEERQSSQNITSPSDTEDDPVASRDRSSNMEKKRRNKIRRSKRQYLSRDMSGCSNPEDESVTSNGQSSNFFENSKDFTIHELQILSGKRIQYQDGGIHISAKTVYVIVHPAATSRRETTLIIVLFSFSGHMEFVQIYSSSVSLAKHQDLP